MSMLCYNSGRTFSSLRLSLTPLCNFSCSYCRPAHRTEEKIKNETHDILFSALNESHYKQKNKFYSPEYFLSMVEKITEVIDLKKIRITGGEPLLYPFLSELIALLVQKNIPDIALTTNGSLASEEKILELKSAGLKRINFSLDSLQPEYFERVVNNKEKHLNTILHAIDFAKEQQLQVKINTIVMANTNINQLSTILSYFYERDIPLRFLELMQMGQSKEMFTQNFVPEETILRNLQKDFSFERLPKEKNSTATCFSLNFPQNTISAKKEHDYRFGVIANYSHPFCSDCDRLRLDSKGNIFGCISSEQSYSIHEASNKKETAKLLALALQEKRLQFSGSSISMAQLGG